VTYTGIQGVSAADAAAAAAALYLPKAGGTVTAHSATAGTALKFASGTVMTTPEAGAIEYDGKVFYSSPAAGARGVDPSEFVMCLSASYTLADSTDPQKMFNGSTNGTLTLPTGTYFFEVLASITAMSTVSNNAAFDILGAGTATLGTILYHGIGFDSAGGATATQTGSISTTSASLGNIVTASGGTTMAVSIRGTFRVTVTGTIIPSIDLANAGGFTPAVGAGSYFRCRCIGSHTMATVGPWS